MQQEPETVVQPQFNEIYKMLMEIRRRRQLRERNDASRNLRTG